MLKSDMELAAFRPIDEGIPIVVECDASGTTLSATLNQGGRPVAFMSRTLQGSEMHYPPVEKEATAIIEAVRKWEHLLARQHFTIITDQRSVAFMLDNRKRTKIKNNKIQGWRLEFASFSYTITYRPGVDNVGPDTLTRAFCASVTETNSNLSKMHNGLCHPNISSQTVIKCLNQLFSLCGTPGYINSDRGSSFISREIKEYLSQKGISTSRTTPYHPTGNAQCERYNGIAWKSIRLALKTHSFPDSHGKMVLPDALHSIRSLLSTSINTTPHERIFGFQRRHHVEPHFRHGCLHRVL